MPPSFFNHPILNSPYDYPSRHWELDDSGQPTEQVAEFRRKAKFITPIPKPKKRKPKGRQEELVFDEGKGLSTQEQQYDQTSIINEVRQQVDTWRSLPASQWQVTPETARLLQHWRHHAFGDICPFFCQVEAVETAIWLTEVVPNTAHVRFNTSKTLRRKTTSTGPSPSSPTSGRSSPTSRRRWPVNSTKCSPPPLPSL